jgi:hypothetical protein
MSHRIKVYLHLILEIYSYGEYLGLKFPED